MPEFNAIGPARAAVASMEIGDSIKITSARSLTAMRNAAFKAPGTFTFRKQDDGSHRVWRIS